MRQLLQQGRSLKEVELQVKKWSTKTSATGGRGRWVTKKYLAESMGYDKPLARNFPTRISSKYTHFQGASCNGPGT